MALLVVPQNSLALLACVGLAFILELLRVVVAYAYCARKSNEVRLLAREKIGLRYELAQIKSAQLELVKKSKLERRLIETERKMDNVKDDVLPSLQRKLRSVFWYIRIVSYIVLSVACFNLDLVVVDANMFFPFATWPFVDKLFSLPAWAVLPIAGLCSRHVLRTLLSVTSNVVVV